MYQRLLPYWKLSEKYKTSHCKLSVCNKQSFFVPIIAINGNCNAADMSEPCYPLLKINTAEFHQK